MRMPIEKNHFLAGLVAVNAFCGVASSAIGATADPAPVSPCNSRPVPQPPLPSSAASVPARRESRPPLAPPAPSPITRRTVAAAAAGVAIAGATTAIAFGVLALQNKHEFENRPTYDRSDNGNNDAAYADGAIALALAAGVTSVVLFLTSEPSSGNSDSSEPTAARHPTGLVAAPMILSHGGGAGALLRF